MKREKTETRTVEIDTLIMYLEEEKKLGATKVTIRGTLLSDKDNAIVLTSEKQM